MKKVEKYCTESNLSRKRLPGLEDYELDHLKDVVFRIPSSSHLRIAAAFWRGFRRSLQVCLFLVMNANISTLMYGLRHRSYFANPSSDVTSAKKVRKHVFIIYLSST